MTDLNWQRTPLITIAYFLLRELKQLVTNISNLIPVFAAVFVGGKSSIWIPFALVGGYLVYLIVSAVLKQRFFLYAIADDAVHLRRGVFNRQNLTLKFERIQQAEIHQAWYFRPFKLCLLAVDSAGAAGKEVEIPGLEIPPAQELRQKMLAETTQPASTGDATEKTNEPAVNDLDYQASFSLSEIIRAGIIDNKIFVALAILSYPLSQMDLIEDYVAPWIEQNLKGFDQVPVWLIASGSVVGIFIALIALAIGIAVFTYYNLNLQIKDGRFQAKSGLLSIRTLSFRYHKLQKVAIVRNLRARALNRTVLRVSQLQPRNPSKQGQAAGNQFVLPVLTADLVTDMRQWLRLPDPKTVQWQKLSNLALLGPGFWLALLFPALAVGLFFAMGGLAEQGVWGVLIAVGVWVLLQTYAVFAWRNYGYVADPEGTWFAVRKGVLALRENWYPSFKVQQIDVSQGPWLRVLGFAHVVIFTPAGFETIKYVPLAQAYTLQQQWSGVINACHRRWL